MLTYIAYENHYSPTSSRRVPQPLQRWARTTRTRTRSAPLRLHTALGPRCRAPWRHVFQPWFLMVTIRGEWLLLRMVHINGYYIWYQY